MAKRTKARSTRRTTSTPRNWASIDRWAAGVMLAIGAALALAFVPTMRQATATAPTASEVQFVDAPVWVGDSLLRHLAETALAADARDPNSVHRAALCAVQETLDKTGWFASVDQVERAADGALVVEATFLTPVAIVEDRYGEAIVDEQGRLLPEGCQVAAGAHVIRLTHPRRHRPVRARRAWESEDVHAGLALLDVIRKRPWASQITAIDLKAWQSREPQLVMITDKHSRIVWGSPPGAETPLEALTQEKLGRLQHLFDASGRVDQHHTGEIDLTDSSVVVRR